VGEVAITEHRWMMHTDVVRSQNEDVCENIKQENSEYRVEKLRRRRRSAIEHVRALEML
jgi:hypothetical protein